MRDTLDVAIVGAGLAGMALAYHLVRADPDIRVGVIDDRKVAGTGGTRWAVGLLRRSFSHPANGALAASTRERVDWAEQQPHLPFAVRRPGSLFLDDGEGQVSAAVMAAAAACGVEARLLGPRDGSGAWPGLCLPTGRQALYFPGDALIDTYDLMDLFWFGSHGSGRVDILFERAVTAFVTVGDRVEAIQTTHGTIRAAQMVIAAGNDAPALCRLLGYDPPVTVLRHGVVMASVPVSGGEETSPLLLDPHGGLFLVVGKNQVLFGGRTPQPAVAKEGEWNWDVLAGFVERAQALSPLLESAEVQRVWSPADLATGDGLPLAGRLPGTANGWILLGFNGQGPALAPGAAALLAQNILGQSAPARAGIPGLTAAPGAWAPHLDPARFIGTPGGGTADRRGEQKEKLLI